MRELACRWFVVGLVATGCAGRQTTIACPEHGGAPWTTLRTEHFLVRTDLETAEARRWTVTLEQIRASLLEAAWHGAPVPPGRLEVVLFRSVDERVQFLTPSADAITYSNLAGDQLVVAQAGDTSRSENVSYEGYSFFVARRLRPEVSLAHEIAHALNDQFLRRQPRWLAEGLAQVLETVTFDVSTQTATLGVPPSYPVLWFRGKRTPNAASLVAGRPLRLDGEAGMAYYADSWALVLWLLNQRGTPFNRYQGRLREGEDPDEAWTAEIGMRGDELEAEVRGYLASLINGSGTYKTYSVPVPVWSGAVQRTTMSDAEVHALWARLLSYLAPSPKVKARLAAEIAEAVRLEPLNPAVLEVSLPDLPRVERATRARAVVAAHPNDWRAHFILGQALEDLPERAAELERAIALDPHAVQTVRWLAIVRSAQGRGDEAVELAVRALDLGGVNPASLAALGDALAASGKCPEAIRVLRRAMDFSSHGLSDETRRRVREHVDDFERSGCARDAPVDPSRQSESRS